MLWAMCACGRVGFDAPTAATVDAAMFHEATGVDPGFGSGGSTIITAEPLNIDLNAVLSRSPSGYLALGTHGNSTGMAKFGLVAFTANGLVDAQLGVGGIVDIGPTINDFGYGAIRLADGRVLVNGDGNGAVMDDFTFGIVDDAGLPDPSFGPGGFRQVDISAADTSVRAVELGGTLIMCGVAAYSAADSHLALVAVGLDGNRIANFGADGIVSDDFSAGGDDQCRDIAALPNGDLVAVGSSAQRILVAVYHPDGTRSTSFGANGAISLGTPLSAAHGVAVSNDGDIVAVGESNGAGLVARLAPDGSLRTNFGQAGLVMPPSIGTLGAVAIQPNDKIVVVGGSVTGNSVIARLTPDGALDPSFGSDGILELSFGVQSSFASVIVEPTGTIVAVGAVGTASPLRGLIARFD